MPDAVRYTAGRLRPETRRKMKDAVHLLTRRKNDLGSSCCSKAVLVQRKSVSASTKRSLSFSLPRYVFRGRTTEITRTFKVDGVLELLRKFGRRRQLAKIYVQTKRPSRVGLPFKRERGGQRFTAGQQRERSRSRAHALQVVRFLRPSFGNYGRSENETTISASGDRPAPTRRSEHPARLRRFTFQEPEISEGQTR